MIRNLKSVTNNTSVGNEMESTDEDLMQNSGSQEKYDQHLMVQTVKTELIESSETHDKSERNYFKHQHINSETDLGDIRKGGDTDIALKYLGKEFHPLKISDLRSINDESYVSDIKREVPDDCEQAICESQIDTIGQNFEEKDKRICEILTANDNNDGFDKESGRGNNGRVEAELQQDDTRKKVVSSSKLNVKEESKAVENYESTMVKCAKSENCELNDTAEDFENLTSGLESDPYGHNSVDETCKFKDDINNGDSHEIRIVNCQGHYDPYFKDRGDERHEINEMEIDKGKHLDNGTLMDKDLVDSVTADKNILNELNIPQCYVHLKNININNMNRNETLNKLDKTETLGLSNLDKAESLNNLDEAESVVVIKTIKEDDTEFTEIVRKKDIPDKMKKHGKSSYKCTACGRVCKTENEAKYHGEKSGCSSYSSAWQTMYKGSQNSNARHFECSICKLTFKTKQNLRMHCLEVHEGTKRKFPCNICLKIFKRKAHLEAHNESVHSDARPHVCTICGRSYKGRGSLSLHMRSHTGEHVTCETCGRDFRDKGDLHKHIRAVHLKIKDFKCDECGHCSSNQSNLTQHIMRNHTDAKTEDRKFQCQECNWRARSSTDLTKHMLTHVKTLDYKCSHCEKQFKCEEYLEKHIRHMHAKTAETYQCTQCPKNFARKDYLNRHVKLHKVARPYKCQICGSTYAYSNHLQRHIQHSHEGKKAERKMCNVCGKNVTYLKQHMQSHVTDKPFECERCNKKFLTEKRLKLHYRVHLDMKPYFCKGCDVGFSRQEFYCTHMRKFHDMKLSPEEAEIKGRIEHMEFSDSDED